MNVGVECSKLNIKTSLVALAMVQFGLSSKSHDNMFPRGDCSAPQLLTLLLIGATSLIDAYRLGDGTRWQRYDQLDYRPRARPNANWIVLKSNQARLKDRAVFVTFAANSAATFQVPSQEVNQFYDQQSTNNFTLPGSVGEFYFPKRTRAYRKVKPVQMIMKHLPKNVQSIEKYSREEDFEALVDDTEDTNLRHTEGEQLLLDIHSDDAIEPFELDDFLYLDVDHPTHD